MGVHAAKHLARNSIILQWGPIDHVYSTFCPSVFNVRSPGHPRVDRTFQ
jgi:hypothetical protein